MYQEKSYPDAHKLVESFLTSKFERSFASIIKTTIHTVDCQTDLTWVNVDSGLLIRNKTMNVQSKNTACQTFIYQNPSMPAEHNQPSKELNYKLT